jgi:hypothetical protein
MSIFEIFAHTNIPTAVDAANLIREKKLSGSRSFDELFRVLAGDFLASPQKATQKYSEREFLKFLEIFETVPTDDNCARRVLYSNGVVEVLLTSWRKNSWQTSVDQDSARYVWLFKGNFEVLRNSAIETFTSGMCASVPAGENVTVRCNSDRGFSLQIQRIVNELS